MMPESKESLLEKGGDANTPDAYSLAVQKFAAWAFDVIRPSILTRAGRMPQGKLRKTAWLDGLRGFAALMVYVLHHQLWAHGAWGLIPVLESSFGYQGKYHFVTLPIIRNFFSGGHFAVAMFFVISGYVLSAKPLSMIQNNECPGGNLASALYRRWLRLFLPVIGTTFVYMCFWHATGIKPEHPPAQKDFRTEFWLYWERFWKYSFIYKHEPVPWTDYNYHSWSIPIEFQGSIVVYTALMAVSRSTRNARLLTETALVAYFFLIVDSWSCAAFSVGLLWSDLDLLYDKGNHPFPQLIESLKPRKRVIMFTILFIALYLGGVPSNDSDTPIAYLRANPGWYWLSYLKPPVIKDPKWAFLFPASALTVWVIPRIPELKAFFETPFIQYLGRVSFSFYLLHGPILWILGDRLYCATGMTRAWHDTHIPGWKNLLPLPRGPLGLELCFLVPQIILFPFTLWMSEIGTKLFDEPSLRFTQWLYKKTL